MHESVMSDLPGQKRANKAKQKNVFMSCKINITQ